MENDRRTFLKHLGGATAAVVATTTLTPQASAEQSAAAQVSASALSRPPGRVRIGLFLAGDKGEQTFAGWLSSAEGGSASAEVVTEKQSPDGVAKKHIAGVKYEDISISCGTGMSKAFYEWVKASFDGKALRKDGIVAVVDYHEEVVETRAFMDALITEIGFPAVDAASKDPAYMSIKFSPEATQFKLGDGATLKIPPAPKDRWLSSNFKIEIDGMDDGTARVSKVDSFTIKQSVAPEGTDGQREPAKVEIPNLVVTLPENHAKEWLKWHDAILETNGPENPDALEKGGSLSYLSPNLKDEYFTLNFSNLGVSKISPPPSSGGDNIRRIKAELYCETIKFDFKASWG